MLSALQHKNLGTTGPWLAIGLALIMMVTRVGHFGESGGPPDASWAIFFLGGFWLQNARLFPAFFALGWVADLVAFSLGTPTDCYSLAYLFLIPAYGSLWAAGHWLGMRGADSMARVSLAGSSGVFAMVAAVLASAIMCFAWANLGMWWMADTAATYSLDAYLNAVSIYLPGYVLTMIMYVALAFGLAMLWQHQRQRLGAAR
jgi:hypothetical protein